MFAFGFIILAAGLWLADSAIQNRPPIETLKAIFQNPTNVRGTLDASTQTWAQRYPLSDGGATALNEPLQNNQTGLSGSGAGTAESMGQASAAAIKALQYAEAQVGKPYKWGAEGPSAFDCSGLMQAAYKSAGINIPRTTGGQIVGGRLVSKTNLLPGDLIFPYPGHVFMYRGGGTTVEAPHTGTNVKIGNVYQFLTARRYA